MEFKVKGKKFEIVKGSQNTAFSLVETIIAIAIISTVVIAPMSLAQHSLFAAIYARDEVTAFHLAEEAIEYARSVRDNNALSTPSLAGTSDWLTGLGSCMNSACGIDITAPSNKQTFACGQYINDCKLTLDPNTGIYGVRRNNGNGQPTGGWNDTNFTRSLKITSVPINSDSYAEADLTATVSWQTGLISRSVVVNEKIFNWYR